MTTPAPETISATLRSAIPDDGRQTTIGFIVEAGAERALLWLLVLLSLPNALFAPPVLAGVAALPTMLFGGQLAFGRSKLWLPTALLERPIAADSLRNLLDRAGRWLDRVEAFGRPRLAWATGTGARRILGLFAILAGLIVLLPVPGTNVLPAAALIVMAVGLLRGDGGLFLFGAALGVAGVLVAVLAAGAAFEILRFAWQAWNR